MPLHSALEDLHLRKLGEKKLEGLLAVLCLFHMGGMSKTLTVHGGLGLSFQEWPRAHAQSRLESSLVHYQQEHRLKLGCQQQ